MTNKNQKRIPLTSFLLCLVFIAVSGCQKPKGQATPSAKLKVVATTGMVADMVRQIGGDYVDVVQLMSSGIDPHLYKANTDDVIAIKRADVVFYNGFKLEGKMSDLLDVNKKDSTNANKIHIALVDAIPKEAAIGDPEHETADPHVWMDVLLWSSTTVLIEKELKRLVPAQSEFFTERAKLLRERLQKLDELGKKWINTIPVEQRIVITSHDAFRYFGRQYGLQVEGIQGVSTATEAGLRRIEELVNLLVDRKVPAAFVESSVPRKYIVSILEGAAVKGVKVSEGGVLYSDAMGATGSGADTYEGMMKHNFKTITTALGGNPTE